MKRIAIIGLLMGMYLQVGAQNVVDVHSHNVLASYTDFLRSHDALMEEGFPIPLWNVEDHLKMMDEAGIVWSVLSMPAPQPYYGNAEESRDVIRKYNVETAEIRRKYPERFKFCASLPLPDVEAAIQEARYALDTVVIIHPHKPSPMADSLMLNTPLAAYEYPAETSRAVINMVLRNVPSRYPNIRFVVPHCGSFLPLAIPRMKNILNVMRQSGMEKDVDWEGNLRNLYYDLAGGVSPDVLRMLLTITSPSHLLFGSDYPYVKVAGVKGLIDSLRSLLASKPEYAPLAQSIWTDNASLLFNPKNNLDKMTTPAIPSLSCAADTGMLIRISEIEVYPEYLNEYLQFAFNVGETSVREETGVIAIFPMIQQRDSCQIRILEIYADEEAYRYHITTPHFQTYKQGTLHMVKSLDLVDMFPMNPGAMNAIFRKMNK